MSSKIDFSDPVALSRVLGSLLANDTATIKRAEKQLKPFLKQPACIVALANQVQGAAEPAVRLQAALMLKKKMVAHYAKLSPANQTAIRTQILPILKAETEKIVSVGLSGCVSTLAKAIFSIGGEWPELFASLMEFCQSTNEAYRFLTYSLLEQLAENVAEHLKPHTATLCHMFCTGLGDTNQGVQVAAMAATTSYLSAMGNADEVMILKPVLSPLLVVLRDCLLRGEEDNVRFGLEVITEGVSLEQPLINDHIEVIVPFLTSILQTATMEPSIKMAAGQTLMDIMEGRPKLVAKKQMVLPVLSALATIIAEADDSAAGALFSFQSTPVAAEAGEDDDDDDDEDDDEEMDLQRLAQTIIDVMAINIPSKFFVEPALTLCAQGMQSPEYRMRKAGCAMLGIISEGCRDALRQGLGSILPTLLSKASDPEKSVREVAGFALGQFSEHCQPEVLHFHQSVLPVVFTMLDDAEDSVKATACYVLEMYCENLQPETLRPFLEPLLARLATLLQTPKALTKETALSAIAAVAVASEVEFLPYAEAICGVLNPLLFNTDSSYFSVRGRSLECLGHIAVAIGAQHFGRYFEMGMQSSMQAISFDDDDLKEHSYVFFANAVKVMGRVFDQYLPTLMPHLLEVVSLSEIMVDEDDEADEDEEADGPPGEDDDDDSDDDSRIKINGIEGFVNKKKAAVMAVGAIADKTHEAFYPYLDGVCTALLAPNSGTIYSYHEIIRGESFEILQYLVQVACITHGMSERAKKGEAVALPPALAEITRVSLQVCLKAMEEDEFKAPVGQACDSLSAILTKVGISSLALVGDDSVVLGARLIKLIHEFLKEKAPCQTIDKVEKDEDDDDDHDIVVIDAISDLIGVLAAIMGEGFIEHFDAMVPHLQKFLRPSRIHSDRSMAIGCFAEVLDEVGPAGVKYTDSLLPLLRTGLTDTMEPVRRNSAFCLSVVIKNAGPALAPHYGELLQWLHPLCIRQAAQQAVDTGGADIDNALSAVARMLSIAPDSVPIPVVLPVMLSALPLRSDAEEGVVVYTALVDLVTKSNPAVVSLLPGILAAVAQTLSPHTKTPDDVKAVVVSALKFWVTSPTHSAVVAAAMGSLDPSLQELVRLAVA